jgi:poly-gamma-glutamate synthesis protein (capsule biosynthesis protein)
MKIALLGDIGLFGRFCVSNGLNTKEYFSDFIKKTEDCDFIVGNLEAPFSKKFKEYAAKSATIGSIEENIEVINTLNINYVNLANNHTGDFGSEGYKLTKKILKANNIKYFGIEGIKQFLDYGNNHICFSGFCNMDSNPVYLSNLKKENCVGINVVDVDKVIEVLQNAKNLGYLNILAFHSGLEHVNLPGREDICFARYLAESFDYVLYGHHPHVVQAYEKFKQSYLFYSIGNFCFDDVYTSKSKEPLVKMTEENRIGLVPILTIENNIIIDVEEVWVYIGPEKMEILSQDSNKIIKDIKNIDLFDLNKTESDRQILLSNRNTARKNKRDLNWYLKRLRLKSVSLILNSKRNRKIYEKYYLNKLKEHNII